jgi:hypothetical protein
MEAPVRRLPHRDLVTRFTFDERLTRSVEIGLAKTRQGC